MMFIDSLDQQGGPARSQALGWTMVDDSYNSAVYKGGKLLWSDVVDEKQAYNISQVLPSRGEVPSPPLDSALASWLASTWWKRLVEFWSLDLKASQLLPLPSWKINAIKKPRLDDQAERPSGPPLRPRACERGHLRPRIT